MDDDYLFPDSPKNIPRIRGNIMDELLAESDFVKSTDSKQSATTKFTLGQQYTSNADRSDREKESKVGYGGDLFGDNSLMKASAERRGRRGISPTVKPVSEEKTSDANWLELKDEPKTSESKSSATAEVKNNKTKPASYLDWLGPKQSREEAPKISTSSAPVVERRSEIIQQRRASVKDEVPLKVISVPTEVLSSNLTTVGKASEPELKFGAKQITQFEANLNDENPSSIAALFELKSKLKISEFERQQLKVELESSQTRHEEELKSIENSLKRRCQLMEESYQRREQQLQDELQSMCEAGFEKRKQWDRERSELISNWQRRLDESSQHRVDDLDKMKEIHHKIFISLKDDHQTAISRLQQIKQVEVDTVNEAESHSKTLQLVIGQLKTNTKELCELQSKVESGLRGTTSEKELLMNAKDEQLKYLKDQLQKQRVDDEQQRLQLQQLVTRLEERLQKQNMELEEEKWKLSREKNRFELERKSWEESKKLTVEQIEMEKQQLHRLKSQLMDEQNSVPTLQPVFRVKDDSFQSLQAAAELEAKSHSIKEEKQRLEEIRNELESANRVLHIKQVAVNSEKSSVDALVLQLKQRSEEVEEMCLSATRTREEGFQAAKESLSFQNELQKRQELLWSRLESLKSRERHLAEERLNVAKERRQLEYLREKLLCVRCQSQLADTKTYYKNDDLSSWADTAERDKEFLQKESLYLSRLQFPYSLQSS